MEAANYLRINRGRAAGVVDGAVRKPQFRNKQWFSDQSGGKGGSDFAHSEGERREHGGHHAGRGKGLTRGSRKINNAMLTSAHNSAHELGSGGEEDQDSFGTPEVEDPDPSTPEERERFYQELVKAREVERKKAIAEGKMDDPLIPKRLEDAITMVGTCMDMCPRFERYRRERENNLFEWETIPGTKRVDHSHAVKMYERAAGDKTLPSDLRPPVVLKRTLDYLFHDLLPRGGFSQTFNFIRDRSRAVRNDFTMQHDTGPLAIECHDRCARFHILALHFERDRLGFSIALEEQQLMNTLQSLKEFYEDQRGRYESPTELEMRVYHRLIHIRDQRERHEDIPAHITDHPVFKLTTKFRQHVQARSAPISKVSPLVVDDECMQIFAELAAVLRDQGSVVMIYLVACILERLFGKETIDDIEVIRGHLSIPDIIDGVSLSEEDAVYTNGTTEHSDSEMVDELEEDVVDAPASAPSHKPDETRWQSTSFGPKLTTPTVSNASQPSSFAFGPPPAVSAFSGLASTPNVFNTSSVFGKSTPSFSTPTSVFGRPPEQRPDPPTNAAITPSPFGTLPSVPNTFPSNVSKPLFNQSTVPPAPPSEPPQPPAISSPIPVVNPKALSSTPTSKLSSQPTLILDDSAASTSFSMTVQPSLQVDRPLTTSFSTTARPLPQTDRPPTISFSTTTQPSPLTDGPPTTSFSSSVRPSPQANGPTTASFSMTAQQPPQTDGPTTTSFSTTARPSPQIDGPPTTSFSTLARPSPQADGPSTTSQPTSLFGGIRPLRKPSTPTALSLPKINTDPFPKSSAPPPITVDSFSFPTSPKIPPPLSKQQPISLPPTPSVTPRVPTKSALDVLKGGLLTSSFSPTETLSPLYLSPTTSKSSILVNHSDAVNRSQKQTTDEAAWIEACQHSDAYRKKVQLQRLSEGRAIEKKREMPPSATPEVPQKRARKRVSAEYKPPRTDEELARRFKENQKEHERRWARGSFLDVTRTRVKKKADSFPSGWKIWLSANPENDGTAIWLEHKFDVPAAGQWESDSIFSMPLSPGDATTFSSPGVIIFECTPLGGVADELDRKFRVLEDCARLRDIIKALPRRRHFVPSLLVFSWTDVEIVESTSDLINMINKLVQEGTLESYHTFSVTSSTQDLDQKFGEALDVLTFDLEGKLVQLLSIPGVFKLFEPPWRTFLSEWLDNCTVNGDFNWIFYGRIMETSLDLLNTLAHHVTGLIKETSAPYNPMPSIDAHNITDATTAYDVAMIWLADAGEDAAGIAVNLRSYMDMGLDFPAKDFLDHLTQLAQDRIEAYIGRSRRTQWRLLKAEIASALEEYRQTLQTHAAKLQLAHALSVRRSPKRRCDSEESGSTSSASKRIKLSASVASNISDEFSSTPSPRANGRSPSPSTSVTSVAPSEQKSSVITVDMLRALTRGVKERYRSSLP